MDLLRCKPAPTPACPEYAAYLRQWHYRTGADRVVNPFLAGIQMRNIAVSQSDLICQSSGLSARFRANSVIRMIGMNMMKLNNQSSGCFIKQ